MKRTLRNVGALSRFPALFLALSVMACAASGTSASRKVANPDVITSEELMQSDIASGTALQAVQRLRPRFLMTRGQVSLNQAAGSVHVSIDGGTLQSVDQLSRYLVVHIAEIRYISASDAAQQYGTAAASGPVIQLKTK
jgi:hypothetical protein